MALKVMYFVADYEDPHREFPLFQNWPISYLLIALIISGVVVGETAGLSGKVMAAEIPVNQKKERR
ncbi:hypothetical protein ACLOAU_23945 [Niabella sp. CJ426]|uniref:hypothetical protein n=1 Tax=Niabella sp. CJ426 TaxID=3393740 RepID=UPI003D092A5D